MRIAINVPEINSILEDTNRYFESIDMCRKVIENNVNDTATYSDFEYLEKTKITHGSLLTLLYLSRPLVDFKIPITNDLIFTYSNIDDFDGYYDKVIDIVRSGYMDEELKSILSQGIKWGLDELSIFACEHVLTPIGVSMSTYDITDLADENEEFRKTTLFTHAKDTAHLINIQDKIASQNENNKKAVTEIVNYKKNNNMKILLKSGSGINKNQLGEVINNIGFKPDIRGKVITTPVDSSFSRGLTTLEDFNTDAIGARKALITSKTQVRQSGYLNRKISVLTEDARIVNVDDCGTKHYLTVTISDKTFLRMYENRYRIDETGELKIIKLSDSWLIGKTIQVRSPITCACKSNDVCKTCYGDLWKINIGKNIGTIANLILTEPMTQKLLSTKHLLKVEVKDFDWDKEFEKYFVIDKNYIIPKDVSQVVYIYKDDLNERETFNVNRYNTERIYLKDKKGEPIIIKSPVRLTLPDSEFNSIDEFYIDDEESYKITLSDMNDIDYMFSMEINNTGIADPLLKIKDMMEKAQILREVYMNSYNMVTQKINDLLIESSTFISAVHVEVIVSCMTFFYMAKEFLLDEEMDIPVSILNINDSIYHSESPIKSLMYQYIVKQLKTDSFNRLFDKDGASEFDRFFTTV